jgi:hypothetical protein
MRFRTIPMSFSSELSALAGRGGPNGGQIYVDGFTGGQLPPKSSIREIRSIRIRFLRSTIVWAMDVEVFTKPGTDKFHGSSICGHYLCAELGQSAVECVQQSGQPEQTQPPITRFCVGKYHGPLAKMRRYGVRVAPLDSGQQPGERNDFES